MKTVHTLTQDELKEAVREWLWNHDVKAPSDSTAINFRTSQSISGGGLPKTEYIATATFEEDLS